MKLIDLHKEWCEAGEMSNWGLCNSVPKKYDGLLELFEPTEMDIRELKKTNMNPVYWGCEIEIENAGFYTRVFGYTPLRQTIVLLICAMKGEL